MFALLMTWIGASSPFVSFDLSSALSMCATRVGTTYESGNLSTQHKKACPHFLCYYNIWMPFGWIEYETSGFGAPEPVQRVVKETQQFFTEKASINNQITPSIHILTTLGSPSEGKLNGMPAFSVNDPRSRTATVSIALLTAWGFHYDQLLLRLIICKT
jgi:hypothetical protein